MALRTKLYVLACFVNLSMLVFNKFFTDIQRLGAVDPETFGFVGQVSVILWGLAYLAAAKQGSKGLAGVFGVEKLFYVYQAFSWHLIPGNTEKALNLLATPDFFARQAGIFYLVYGFVDLLFGLVFFADLFGFLDETPNLAKPAASKAPSPDSKKKQ